ncbi:MAG: hypothetical protein Q4D27_03750 [Coriobacteriia bacterium]|nr:hypothetical protein [Coriobacteriia bacterium]
MLKKALSLLIALSCATVLFCGAAFANETHSVVVASDRHGNTVNIKASMDGVNGDAGDSVDYVSLIGDMVGSGSGSSAAPAFDSSEVLGEVQSVGFPKVNAAAGTKQVSILWADHDAGVNDDAGIVFANGGKGSGLMYTAYNDDGSVAYYVYGIGFYEMATKSSSDTDIADVKTAAQAAAADFETWVDTQAEKTAPIIVFCHAPLHYARGDNYGADAWNKALNYAATGSETTSAGAELVRNVVFMHGHNHTTETKGDYSGEFFVPCGSEMEIGATEDAWSAIYYTYTTAGYLKNGAIATLLSVDYDGLTFYKYKDGAVSDSVYDTESYKSKKFASEFRTAGVNEVERVRLSLDAAEIGGIESTYAFAGEPIAPKPVVTLDGDTLREGIDYELEYADNTNAGTATVTVKGIRGYEGEIAVSFEVAPLPINDAQVTGPSEYPYTGSAIEPTPAVTLDGVALEANKDFTVSCTANEVGNAVAIIKGIGNYTGEVDYAFKIVPAPIDGAEVTGLDAQVYTGEAFEPEPTVTLNGVTLTSDVDYTVAYANNVNVGTATVTIEGMGNYTGVATAIFEIAPISISGARVTGLSEQTYTGKELKPAPTVTLDGATLKAGTDYTVSYKNNVNAGTASVVVAGTGIYGGSVTATFTINKASLADATVSGIAKKTYTGKALTQTPTVKVGGATLKQGTDYTLAYKSNKNVGTATVTIKGTGNYSGSVAKSFKIVKAANTLKVTAKKPALKASSLKKKAQVIKKAKAYTVKTAKGTVTYKLTSVSKTAFKKFFKVNAKNGNITVKKGLKKGTYKVKVKVTAAGTANYKKLAKTVTVVVKVK